MKKYIIFLLSILYMVTSSGLAMEVHYCMGERAGVYLFEKEQENCGKCGMTEKKGCCHDEHKFYKLDGGYKYSQNVIQIELPQKFLTRGNSLRADLVIDLPSLMDGHHPQGPPSFSGCFRCILFCVFRL